MEEGIVHQYVDVIVIARDLYVVLPSHECKTGTHFDEKLLYMLYEPELHIALIVLVGKSKHIEDIGIFEHRFHIVGFRWGKCRVEIVCQGSVLAIIVEFDGFLQIACRPMVGDALHHIPIACAYVLDLLNQYKIMSPVQMSDGEGEIVVFQLRNRWFRNCGNVTFHHRQFFIVFIIELYHILHIAYREAFDLGIFVLQINSQPLQGFLAPAVCFLALLQHAANIPVHPEHFFIGSIDCPLLSDLQPLFYFAKQCRITAEVIRHALYFLYNCIFIHTGDGVIRFGH